MQILHHTFKQRIIPPHATASWWPIRIEGKKNIMSQTQPKAQPHPAPQPSAAAAFSQAAQRHTIFEERRQADGTVTRRGMTLQEYLAQSQRLVA
jgi:hypothetical protein